MSEERSQIPRLAADSATFDDVDRAILGALALDGRITNTALATRVNLAESTTAQRVRALKQSGVIKSINARLDLAALGHPIQAVIKVRLGSHNRKHVYELYDRMVTIPGVLSVLHVAGEDDFLLHVAVRSSEALRDLVLEHITTHPAVRQTETQLVFEVREGAGVLPD